MNKEVILDLKLYLAGGIKLKEVMSKHNLSKYKATTAISEISKGPIELPVQRVKIIKASNVHIIVSAQIEREKRIRVTEEICQEITITPELFLNSRLVNSNRIYGAE